MTIMPTAFATTRLRQRAPIILNRATDHWCTKKVSRKNMKNLHSREEPLILMTDEKAKILKWLSPKSSDGRRLRQDQHH